MKTLRLIYRLSRLVKILGLLSTLFMGIFLMYLINKGVYFPVVILSVFGCIFGVSMGLACYTGGENFLEDFLIGFVLGFFLPSAIVYGFGVSLSDYYYSRIEDPIDPRNYIPDDSL